MPTRRKPWLDALRALAMLLVMIGHCSHQADSFFYWTTPVKIPLFFAISGYLFRVDARQTFGSFLLSRVRRLLIPYVILAVLHSGIIGAAEIFLLNESASTVVLTRAMELTNGTTLWFIPCLMWVEIALFWIHRAASASRASGAWTHMMLTVIPAVAAVPLMRPGHPLPWHPETAFLMILFAQLGHALRRLEGRLSRLAARWGFVLSGIYLLLCTVQIAADCAAINISMNRWPCLPLNLLTCTVGICALFMIFPRMPIPRFAAWMLQNTLGYYAFHQIAQMGLTFILLRLLPLPDPESCLWSGLLIVLMACALCAIPSAFINRFCPFVVGKRKAIPAEAVQK